MAGKCVAFANNDIVLVAWTYEQKLAGCVGFDVRRIKAGVADTINSTIQGVSLPAMAGFPSNPNAGKAGQTTADSPIQKFFWKDLYVKQAGPSGEYVYQIVPLEGTFSKNAPPQLRPLASGKVLFSNPISLTTDHGPKEDSKLIQCCFNRGILATQAVARQLPKGTTGAPSKGKLLARIADPTDSLRKTLGGDLLEALPTLLKTAKEEGGSVYGALYELNDKELESYLIGNKNLHLVLSNTFDSTSGDPDKENAPARAALHHSGVDVTDRILPDGNHIGHNKFLLYCDGDGNPAAVLTGSTNWTSTGLCAQTNNAIIIRNKALAQKYSDYWDALLKDTQDAEGDGHALQGGAFRTSNATARTAKVPGASATTIWFSPNTKQKNKVKNVDPPDMTDIYARIKAAKKAVLFLAFDPGTPSVIEAAAEALAANPDLFIRGALTNKDRAGNFIIDLHNEKSKPSDPAKVIPATGVDDAFGIWEKELNNAGHAVIHNKIVVIDPFDEDGCVLMGSHNLGDKASSTNDENFVVFEGNVSLASAYTIHVLDVYDHYRWRYLLSEYGTKDSWQGLEESDAWQKPYFNAAGKPDNPELRFWLDA